MLANQVRTADDARKIVRARKGAPVSMPISWAQLKPSLNPGQFSVTTVRRYLATRKADPWRGYWRARQRLKLPV